MRLVGSAGIFLLEVCNRGPRTVLWAISTIVWRMMNEEQVLSSFDSSDHGCLAGGLSVLSPSSIHCSAVTT